MRFIGRQKSIAAPSVAWSLGVVGLILPMACSDEVAYSDDLTLQQAGQETRQALEFDSIIAEDQPCTPGDECLSPPAPHCDRDDLALTVYLHPGHCNEDAERCQYYFETIDDCSDCSWGCLYDCCDEWDYETSTCTTPKVCNELNAGCRTYGRCWPGSGCVYDAAPGNSACDEDDLCTKTGHCCTQEEITEGLCGIGECLGADPIPDDQPCSNGAEGMVCMESACVPVCGDGFTAEGEFCDGGTVDTETCDYAEGAEPHACTEAVCGDGYTNAAAREECDDGSENSNTLPNACREDCTEPRCGDGVKDDGEECDEGGDAASCDADCTVPECGDGRTNAAAGEGCDGGSADTVDCDYAGGTGLHACTIATCGDDYRNAAKGEQCDTGGDTASCDADCTVPVCGDGHRNAAAGEGCDGGSADTVDCDYAGGTGLHACTIATCGDDYRNAAKGEECDEGSENDDYGHCSSECGPTLKFCGNDICEPEERESCGECAEDCAGELACNDAIACTLNDVCQADGTCGGTPKSCPTEYTEWNCRYPNTCSTSATGTRSRVSYTCSNGACVSTGSTTETKRCGRDTYGEPCTFSGKAGTCHAGKCRVHGREPD